MTRTGWVAFFAAALSSGGCARTPPVDTEPPMTVRAMETPAGPDSGEPNLTVGADGGVLLSWIEPTADQRHALKYARRVKDGSPLLST